MPNNPDCPKCHGTGTYKMGDSPGYGPTTYKCDCTLPAMLLAIDPGVSTGWALYLTDTKRLWACGCGDPRKLPNYRPTHVVIELPQVYNKRKVDPNDLVTLAVQVGEYKNHFYNASVCEVELVWPSDWKGTLKKEMHHNQCLKIWTPEELSIIYHAIKGLNQKGKSDVFDACALGLWKLKRWPARPV